jgi:hypothetical protein
LHKHGSESRISINPDDKKIRKQAESLYKTFEGQIKNNIEGFKHLNYNPNTKGADYEEVINDLLTAYLGPRFDFYTRAQIVDREMKYTNLFKGKAKEIDVVGTFKSSIPRFVLKAKKSVIIPYDAIAIISEVKYVLNIENLNEDLEKFKKLDQLNPSEDRLIIPLTSPNTRADKPFRLLVYFKTPKALDGVMNLLARYIDFWDAVFLVDKEEVLFNGNLPFMIGLEAEGKVKYPPSTDVKIVNWSYASFMFLLRVITRTVPIPIAVDVMSTLLHIASLTRPNEKENKKNQTKGRRLSE